MVRAVEWPAFLVSDRLLAFGMRGAYYNLYLINLVAFF